MGSFQSTSVNKESLNKVPIYDGQVIQVYDSQEHYIDYNGKRIQITDIIIVDTYNDLKRITNPIEGKFYFVKDPTVLQLYFFDGKTFVKTSGYTHPIYDIKEGQYRSVTVNKMGHVIAANNDTLPIELGGTGCTNVDQLNELIKNSSNTEIESIKTDITNTELQITNIINDINSVRNSILNLENSINTDTTDLSDKIDSILSSYYIRESSSTGWIKDNSDGSYYIMILKSDYKLLDVFPNVTVYKKIESGYQTTKGIYDNTDYNIIISDNYDVTIKTSNPFDCKIIINTI